MAPPFLPVITRITREDGADVGPAEELRILDSLTARYVDDGDGPPRLELGEVGGTITGLTVTAPLVKTGTSTPNIALPAATDSSDGYMSGADKNKLDNIGNSATVVSITPTAPITVGGTAAIPVVGISAASGGAAGSMSAAHYTLVNGADKNASNNSISVRGSAGEGTYTKLVVGAQSSTFAADRGCTPFDATWASSYAFRGIDGEKQRIVLDHNTTFLAPTNYANGSTLKLWITQGGTGLNLATWTSGAGGFYFGAGFSGTLIATSAGDCDFFQFEHFTLTASHWVCTIHFKYSPP